MSNMLFRSDALLCTKIGPNHGIASPGGKVVGARVLAKVMGRGSSNYSVQSQKKHKERWQMALMACEAEIIPLFYNCCYSYHRDISLMSPVLLIISPPVLTESSLIDSKLTRNLPTRNII